MDATACLDLYGMVTYLLESIYRFVMLAPVSKAASRLKIPPFKMSHPDPPSLVLPWTVRLKFERVTLSL